MTRTVAITITIRREFRGNDVEAIERAILWAQREHPSAEIMSTKVEE